MAIKWLALCCNNGAASVSEMKGGSDLRMPLFGCSSIDF